MGFLVVIGFLGLFMLGFPVVYAVLLPSILYVLAEGLPLGLLAQRITYALDSFPLVAVPLFIFTSIPFPGTPLFHELIAEDRILPNTKMRDLESSTLSVQPLDPIDDVVGFIRGGKNLRGHRRRVMRHQREHIARYRDSLSLDQKIVSNLAVAAILFPGQFSSPKSLFVNKRPRTHVSTTDRLDDVYTPRLRVDSRWAHHFEPTVLVGDSGELNPKIAEDALDTRFRNPERIVKVGGA